MSHLADAVFLPIYMYMNGCTCQKSQIGSWYWNFFQLCYESIVQLFLKCNNQSHKVIRAQASCLWCIWDFSNYGLVCVQGAFFNWKLGGTVKKHPVCRIFLDRTAMWFEKKQSVNNLPILTSVQNPSSTKSPSVMSFTLFFLMCSA